MDDSDDSAFLFLPSTLKRKASIENNEKTKQLRLSNEDKKNNSNQDDHSVSPICIQISSGSSTESNLKDKENHNDENIEEKSEFLETMNEVEKKITMTCPLCLKIFDNSTTHLSHMKQCAKKKKMTTQQLLNALELQKKQMEERRALGLSSQMTVSEVKKNNNKKKAQDVDPESNFQLALALAMSKSLEDQGSSNSCSSQPISDSAIEAQKVTLEKFGFTSSSSTGPQIVGRKKFKTNRKSILRERTKEDRERIISEKASEILLEDDGATEIPQRKENELFEESSELLKYQEPGSRLWKGSEDEKVTSYYVESIKEKLDVPDSQKSSQNAEILSGGSSIPTEDIQSQITKLNSPTTALSESWRKMINNKELSDLTVRTKDDKIIYLHSIVLHVRIQNAKDIESIIKNYNFSTIINFLEFLYSGVLNKDMKRTDIENLYSLAECINFKNLVDVLNNLKENLKINSESSDGVIPSSLSPFGKPESPDVAIISKESSVKDWEDDKCENDWAVDEMVDLTQSSHDSFPEENPDENSDRENLNNSYWSFAEHDKKMKEMEELEKQEEEKENLINSNELYKIEAIMKKQKELSQELLNDDEDNYKNKLEREKIYGLQIESNNEEKDMFEDYDKNEFYQTPKKKIDVKQEECIVLSSDSNASFDEENTERLFKKSKPLVDLDYEIPAFDPYDHYNNDLVFNMTPLGARDNIQSQSLLSGGFSPVSSRSKSVRRSLEMTPPGNSSQKEMVKDTPKELENPEFFSTPIPDKRIAGSFAKKNSTAKKSGKRKTDSTSKKILRSSVRLSIKSRIRKTNSIKKRTVRKSITKDKRKKKLEESAIAAEILTKSILNEFNNSLGPSSSSVLQTPITKRKYLEVTPVANPGVEYTEKVTPMPDYSAMEGTILKQHLAKYGLKRSLAKSKAKKILKHIYEELHPIFNTETGKIVKYLPEEKPKPQPKKRTKNNKAKPVTPQKSPRIILETPEKNSEDFLKTPEKSVRKILGTPEKSDKESDASVDSMNKSTDYDSDGSEYDYSKEQLTQTSSANKIDLPTAFNEYIQNNQEYHRKILLYEPIWIEELQNLLLLNFNKKFKLSDLMDFLDKQCITFRSEAQKKNNQRRNEKKKASPKKKSPRKPTRSQSGSSLGIS